MACFKIKASEAVKRPATELIPAISKVLYKDWKIDQAKLVLII